MADFIIVSWLAIDTNSWFRWSSRYITPAHDSSCNKAEMLAVNKRPLSNLNATMARICDDTWCSENALYGISSSLVKLSFSSLYFEIARCLHLSRGMWHAAHKEIRMPTVIRYDDWAMALHRWQGRALFHYLVDTNAATIFKITVSMAYCSLRMIFLCSTCYMAADLELNMWCQKIEDDDYKLLYFDVKWIYQRRNIYSSYLVETIYILHAYAFAAFWRGSFTLVPTSNKQPHRRKSIWCEPK